jgi:hypothetical protein
MSDVCGEPAPGSPQHGGIPLVWSGGSGQMIEEQL